MSILIRGMEMPASCLSCPHNEHGTIHEWELYCGLTGDYIGHWDDKSLNNGHRPDWCPLVEVPTPHGTLIDSDEIIEVQMFDEMYEEWTLKTMSVAEYLAFAADMPPTIIEAEEGEEE